MPFEHVVGDVLRELQILAHAVAIVVVSDVFSPVHEWRTSFAGFLAVIICVDLFLASVDFYDGSDEDDRRYCGWSE